MAFLELVVALAVVVRRVERVFSVSTPGGLVLGPVARRVVSEEVVSQLDVAAVRGEPLVGRAVGVLRFVRCHRAPTVRRTGVRSRLVYPQIGDRASFGDRACRT